MAGVYIPGMNLPKCCSKCGFYQWHYDGGWGQYDKCSANHVTCNDSYDKNAPRLDPFKEKLSTCPLVEVPDHGDLIDKNRMIDVLHTGSKCVSELLEGAKDEKSISFCQGANVGYTNSIIALDGAPVVIPADKEVK